MLLIRPQGPWAKQLPGEGVTAESLIPQEPSAEAAAPQGSLPATDDYTPGRWERFGQSGFMQGVRPTLGVVPKPVWALIFAALVILYHVKVQNGYWIRIGGTVARYIILGVGLNIVAGYTGLLEHGLHRLLRHGA